MVAVAIGGAAVIGAGASIASSSKASKTAKDTAASNNALQAQIYNENAQTLAPYVAAGNKATPLIEGLLGEGDAGSAAKAYQTWQNSTGYQSRLKQGQDSVTAALGAKGLTDSGAALKSLTRYGQDYATNDFQTYLGDLTNQQGVGLTAASAQAGVGQNYANAVSANNNTAANASENAALSTGSSINSALGNALSAYTFSNALGSSYGSGSLGGAGNYGLGDIY